MSGAGLMRAEKIAPLTDVEHRAATELLRGVP